MKYFNLLVLFVVLVACQPQTSYDIIIKNGLVYDGTNSEPIRVDIAINADTIAKIGKLKNSRATEALTPQTWSFHRDSLTPMPILIL